MRVLVIGGTQFIGRALVKSLVKAGHHVAILHRKPGHGFGKKVEDLVADRNDASSLRSVVAGRRFQVVFDNVYDWERGTTADQVIATAEAVSSDSLERYLFMSSVAAYGDGLEHREEDPLAPDGHADSYVRNKAMSERALFRFRQRNGFPVVTFRPPFIYGPEQPFYREQFFWDRMKMNRPIIVPGDGLRLMQFVYLKDLVQAMLAAMKAPGAVGEAFNVANPKPITQSDLIENLSQAARKKPQIVYMPRQRIQRAGGQVFQPPLYFGEYYDLPPITEITNKAQRILKFQATPFLEGLKEEYKWYQRNHKMPETDFAMEDTLLSPEVAAGK
ncbi:MAG: NAD-dependent epimerase/dehydratase family protein [Bryobacterales bacterium]|nr:NAD-dependent epimerase/dehydratase family protein [Bryobacterales bacterium]